MWNNNVRDLRQYEDVLTAEAAEQCVERFFSDAQTPTWPFFQDTALAFLAGRSCFYRLVHAAASCRLSSAALQKLVMSPVLQKEAVAVQLSKITTVAYQNPSSCIWNVWQRYMQTPCWSRFVFTALFDPELLQEVASNVKKSVSDYLSSIFSFPNIVEYGPECVRALFLLGVLCLEKNRDIHALVHPFQRAINSLKHSAHLINIIGNAMRKNDSCIDIWTQAYRFLFICGVPIRYSIHVHPRLSTYCCLYVLTPDGNKKYKSKNGSKDLLVSAVRRLCYADYFKSKFSAEGEAFARAVLRAHRSRDAYDLMLQRLITSVDDVEVLSYLFSDGINFKKSIVHLFERLWHAHRIDDMFFLVANVNAEFDLSGSQVPEPLLAELTKYVRWKKSKQLQWIFACSRYF